MNITSLFIDAAHKHPLKTAIIENGREISFSDLENDVRKTAAYFMEKGIRQGDRVLVFVPMGINLYRIVLALFYCGATAVFLDEWVNKRRMEMCCEIAGCKGFIGSFKARAFTLFSRELRRIPVKLKIGGISDAQAKMAELKEGDPALITFTTGSTGRPKAANRTHGFLKAQFDALIDEINPKPGDIDMPVLPIVLFMNLGVGCTSVIAKFKHSKPDKMKPGVIARQLITHKVNRLIASPFFVIRLAEYCQANTIQMEGINKVFTGGAPVFPEDAAVLTGGFSNAEVIIVYGSTEVEPISKISANDLIGKKESIDRGLPVGKIYSNATVRIIGITEEPIAEQTEDSFQKLLLPQGEIGEIIVSGPHVLKAYYNSDEAFRANKIIVGDTIWHRTGDSGYLDNEELYLTGRCAQLFKSGDSYVSGFMVEHRLASLEGVTVGTLIKLGNEIVLCAETHLSEDVIASYTSDIYKDRIEVLQRIPRDPRHNSKIDYGKLREMVRSEL